MPLTPDLQHLLLRPGPFPSTKVLGFSKGGFSFVTWTDNWFLTHVSRGQRLLIPLAITNPLSHPVPPHPPTLDSFHPHFGKKGRLEHEHVMGPGLPLILALCESLSRQLCTSLGPGTPLNGCQRLTAQPPAYEERQEPSQLSVVVSVRTAGLELGLVLSLTEQPGAGRWDQEHLPHYFQPNTNTTAFPPPKGETSEFAPTESSASTTSLFSGAGISQTCLHHPVDQAAAETVQGNMALQDRQVSLI